MTEDPAVARARELVLTYGWNSTSFQIVNPGIKRWFSDDGKAVVGYIPVGGYRVVAGAPVCEKALLPEIIDRFESDSQRNDQKVCYFCAERRLETAINGSPTHSRFLIGAQPAWDPASWPSIVSEYRSLRAQLNRSRNKGVAVTEWPTERAASDERLRNCLHRWLDSKGLPPLHFMVEPETLGRLEHRRIFVAECKGQVVGFLTLSPISRRDGWLFEQFPHTPGAPNGTVELMIDSAMRTIANDGCRLATLGLSPLSKRAKIDEVEEPFWLKLILGWLRKHGQRFYNFDGLDAFKAKLKPNEWEPVFAIANEPNVSFRTIYAIGAAFTANAPLRTALSGIGRAAMTEFHWMTKRFRHVTAE